MYRNFNTIIRRLKVVVLALFVAVVTLLSGCKKEDIPVYEVQLECSSSAMFGTPFLDYTLTETDNTFRANIGTYPCNYIYHQAQLIVRRESWGWAIVDRFSYGNSPTGVTLDYQIEQGNKTRKGHFSEIDSDPKYKELGVFFLEKTAGVHKLTYYVPALPDYGTSETVFYLELIVEDDSRTKEAEIILENKDYAKYQIVNEGKGTYDVFVLSEIPVFCVINEPGDFRFMYYDSSGGPLRVFYIRPGDDKKYRDQNIDEPGIYFCMVYFAGDSEYIPFSYYCYIVLTGL